MENSQLFRREVIDAQRHGSLGTIRLASPVSHGVWAVTALGIATIIVGWLLMGHYTRREHVSGTLVPTAGLMDMNARSSGAVSRVNVSEGKIVHEGDVLLVLSGEQSSETLGDTNASVSKQLREQQLRLAGDLASTQHLADQQAQALGTQISNLGSQIGQLDAQIVIAGRQHKNYITMLDKIQPLVAAGYVSGLQVQQQQAQALDAESQLKALTRQRFDVVQQVHTAREQLEQLPFLTENKLNDIRRQMAEGAQSLAKNEAERALVIRAPRDGVVSSLLVKPGQAVAVGQPLVSLVPHESLLEAQLLVPSSAIGFVRDGTSVSLHYQAFPYQKFGVHHGRVAQISRSALTPSEVTALLGEKPPSEALYRVLVRLDTQQVQAYGKFEPLMAGMAVDAELMLDKRRLIEWIFEPLYGMSRRLGGAVDGVE